MKPDRILLMYYAATLVFLLLDYGAGLNVRIAFLEPWPAARAGYYGVCFACLALMIWRPSWTTLIGTFESLVTMIALIFSMALRVLIPNDAIFAENADLLTSSQVMNFIISGYIAYLAWIRGLRALNLR